MKILHLGRNRYCLQTELRFQDRARELIRDQIHVLIGHLLETDPDECRAIPYNGEATTVALTVHSVNLSPEKKSSLLPRRLIEHQQDDKDSIGKVTIELDSVKTSVTSAISNMTDTLTETRGADLETLQTMLGKLATRVEATISRNTSQALQQHATADPSTLVAPRRLNPQSPPS